MPASGNDDAVRLDKWLWAARLFKTRSLARDEIERGRVTVNDEHAKPARTLRVGDRLDLRQGALVRSVVVMGLSAVRGPAPVAATLYRETEESVAAREQHLAARREAGEPAQGRGRPTKRDRRVLAEWQRWSASSESDPPAKMPLESEGRRLKSTR